MKETSLRLALTAFLFCVVGTAAHDEPKPARHGTTPAKGNRIDCKSVVEGEEVGGKFDTKVSFDASVPSLSDVVTITETGKPSETTKTTYLSAKSVCGLNIDFAKECKVKEKLERKFGYSYKFTCGTDITSGEIYCDENGFADPGTNTTFKCEGPKVDKKLKEGFIYSGCRITEAS